MAVTLWFCVLLSLASWYQVRATHPSSHSTVVDGKKKYSCQDIGNEEMTTHRVDDMKKLPCSYGGDRDWFKVAYLNMNNPNWKCPSNWNLTTTTTDPPIRGCGRTSTEYGTCDSVVYPVHGRTYSAVCGRVIAIQRGSSYAFYNTTQSNFSDINTAYVSGVSLTHGPPHSRQHIWSFAGAMTKLKAYSTTMNCPCSNSNITWPYQVPPFVGNDYFCDTANPYFDYWQVSNTYFIDDPLWDGKGCDPQSTCCSFNTPPLFCKSLPKPTSDDLEIRLCCKSLSSYEDKLITLVDIYVN